MADDQEMNIQHRQTWVGFCNLLSWALIIIVFTLLMMAAFLL